MKCSHVVGALLLALLATAAQPEPTSFDVLVYGSTPGGIMAAVAAARHGARTALLSQRAHVGGVVGASSCRGAFHRWRRCRESE